MIKVRLVYAILIIRCSHQKGFGQKVLVKYLKYGCLGLFLALAGCRDSALNDPYPNEPQEANTLYASFNERPKHLDPAKSYSSNEWIITNQIYEPPLQYHYLKRPYSLIPQAASKMPKVSYLDKHGVEYQSLAVDRVAYTLYEVEIQPGIMFQPHPAFAKDKGQYLYHEMTDDDVEDIDTLSDFPQTGQRELTADDYVYQIKRLADSTLNSPIFGLMQNYIAGLDEFEQKLSQAYKDIGASSDNPKFIDLNSIPLDGVKVLDKYTYQIKIIGTYPQFKYWLAMPFFAPMPWEAVKFHAQPALIDRNITLDWYPVGTGPFMMQENNPNLRMVMVKNPNYHGEAYPQEGAEGDLAAGLLDQKGKPLPFLDSIIFTLEKESIPYWNKFLQGYFDQSGISSDSFDQALQATGEGGLELTSLLEEKGIELRTAILPTTFYWAFNMLDDVVGGYDEKQKALRQAISIAMDIEEYIQIFSNGRAVAAHSPLPPGIFGYQEGKQGFNSKVYDFDGNQMKRKSLDEAKALLTKAGFKGGINPKTNQPLTLYLDATMSSGPDSQAIYAWVRKQFKKLGIELVVRATQYNRFQDKISSGNAQIFSWGWNADYPDPENFLFLLYGPNAKVAHGGENAVNYQNPEFDALFTKMKSMPNGEERQLIITKMLNILQEDAPWVWGFHPKMYALSHSWMGPQKPNAMSRNTLKYVSVEPKARALLRKAWNQPIFWPLLLLLIGGFVLCIPAYFKYRHKIHTKPTLEEKN